MILINNAKLTSAVKRAALRVAKRAVQPILRGILLEISNDGDFAVTGTDLDSYFKTGSVGKAVASVVVEPKALLAALKPINGEVMVKLDGEVLKVASTHGHVSVNVPTLGFGEDFPSPETVVANFGGAFEGATVLSEREVEVIAGKVAPVCAQYDTASILGGVSFKAGVNTTQVCGTDGSRMVVATFNSPWAVKPAVIPCGIWESLTGGVVVRTNSQWAMLVDSLGTTWVKLITGEYPRYEELLPPVGESQGYREYNRKEFIAALKSIKAVADNKRLNAVASVGLWLASPNGEVVLDVQGRASDGRALGLNVPYLLDWAGVQRSEYLTITITGTGKQTDKLVLEPVMLEDDQFADYGVRHLLMPVQFKSEWTDKHARSLAEDNEAMDSRKVAPAPKAVVTPKVAPKAVKPLPVKVAPAPKAAPVSGACKHLRKLIANHMLTCRDCKYVVETLSA